MSRQLSFGPVRCYQGVTPPVSKNAPVGPRREPELVRRRDSCRLGDIEINEGCLRTAGSLALSSALAEIGVSRAGQHSHARLSKLPRHFIADAFVGAGD